ncbi:cullin-4A [Trichonephila clavipes]|nr:cullin-4A [Trichonephila clavipes]
MALGLSSNPGEDMDVCKCIMPSRHGGTLISSRAASPLVRMVEGEERREAPDHPQGLLSQNRGEIELNSSVTCMVLKATANDRVLIWVLPIRWHLQQQVFSLSFLFNE